jgi:hypothetical protein
MKFIIKLFVLIVVVSAVVIGAATFYLDTIAKKAIEFGGSEALGVATTVDDLNISILSGSTTLSGFSIANPQGFSNNLFMVLKQGKVNIDTKTLMSDIIHISEISFVGLHLSLEQSSQSSNVKALLGNVPQSKSSLPATQPEAPASTPSSQSGKKFVVDRLILDDIAVSAKIQALGTKLSDVSLTIPRIELTNIGQQQGGMMMPELVEYIVTEVINAVAKNSGSLSPALASMLKGDLASIDGIKAGAKDAASVEANRAAKKLIDDLDLPEGSNTELEETADTLIKGLFK